VALYSKLSTTNRIVKNPPATNAGAINSDSLSVGPVSSSSGPGAADQGEGAPSSAAVRAHGGGALEAAGRAEAERGAP